MSTNQLPIVHASPTLNPPGFPLNPAKTPVAQLVKSGTASGGGVGAKHTNQAPDFDAPLLISKKWLCWHFRLVHPGGKCNYPALYQWILTPDVLAAMGLSTDQVRRPEFKTFNRVQTVRLIELLAL